MNRGRLIRSLGLYFVLLGSMLEYGCATKTAFLKTDTPFVPVNVVFGDTRAEDETEDLIRAGLFCESCLFKESISNSSPYTMKIDYYRIIDPKAFGGVLLSGGMASIEAEFSYSLQVSIMQGAKVLKEYAYTRRNIEKTDSGLDGILNPFHKSNSLSEEVFSDLIITFLHEVCEDSFLPKQNR